MNPDDDPLLGNSVSGLLGAAMETVQPDSQAVPDNWEPPTPEHISVLLPQYHIEHLIGRGGMGAVYKGRQFTLNRPVAIKVLPVELSRNTEFLGRFHREAQLLASLSHQGIVTIFDFGQTTEGHLYFVMEFVDGTDLHRLIHKTKLDAAQALSLTVQICEAMQYAHDMGVIHRDIKPANVLVTRDGRAKLADFGLAMKPTEHASEVPEPPQPADFDPSDPMGIAALRFTKPGTAMGTPDYAAPEVYEGKADARSDIYALGIMLYEMLTGAPPKGYYQLPSTKAKVDVRIDRVVVKALEPDPSARYQKASDMKLAVEQASKPLPAKAPAPPKASQVNKPSSRSQIGVPVGVPALAGQSKSPAVRPPARAVSAPPQQKRRSSLSSTATFMIGALLILGVVVAYDADREWVMTRSLLASLGFIHERKTIQRIEGEEMKELKVTRGKTLVQDRKSDHAAMWSGDSHVWWGGGQIGDTLTIRLPIAEAGRQRVKGVLTCNSDFGIVEVTLDDTVVEGSPFDMQAEGPGVSDILDWGVFDLAAGGHELKFKVVGTHGTDTYHEGPYCVGVDYIQLEPPALIRPPAAVGTDVSLTARPSASNCSWGDGDYAKHMNEGKEPTRPSSSHPFRMTWYPRKGGMEWAQYEWETPQVIDECRVVWFADGASTMPVFWRLLYREESGAWVPVQATIPNAEPDKWSVVKFPAVKTTALRISAQCKEGWSAGICHWKAIAADPDTVADPKLRAHPDVFLGDLSPLHSHVGDGIFHVNYVDEPARKDGGSITVGTKSCDQFLWAHADSRLEFAIPSGYTRFKATGVTSAPKTWFVGSWKYLVQVDGKTVFESKELNTYADKQLPMDVVLPPGSKRLTLITDSCGDGRWDWAYWAYPTLIPDDSVTAETVRGSDSKQASSNPRPTSPDPSTGSSKPSSSSSDDKTETTSATIGQATKEKPFINSLGMKFVPVPGSKILMCVHKTRKRDFAIFAAQNLGVHDLWKTPMEQGKPVDTGDDYPVMSMSWDDAHSFCEWLSKKEGRNYRMPMDQEWCLAAAIPTDPKAEILYRDRKEEVMSQSNPNGLIAPVMNFKPNNLGFFDLVNNPPEWCEDRYDDDSDARVIRAVYGDRYKRAGEHADTRRTFSGFRCVIETDQSSGSKITSGASRSSKLLAIKAEMLDVPDSRAVLPLNPRASSAPAANDAIEKRLAEIEANFRAARGHEAGKSLIGSLPSNVSGLLNLVLEPLGTNIPLSAGRFLATLRDDLVSEGRTKASASLDAYRAAYALCNAMISAYDERSSAKDSAAWAVRSSALRPQFDDLNKTFLEALRKPAPTTTGMSAPRPNIPKSNPVDPIIGRWGFFNNSVRTFFVDGASKDEAGQTATWKCDRPDEEPRRYTVVYEGGKFTDHLTLINGGTFLDGSGMGNVHVTANRISPPVKANTTLLDISADLRETARLRDTLLAYKWHYTDVGFPSSEVLFYNDNTFHPKWHWHYWILDGHTIHVQFGRGAYAPGKGDLFKFNDKLTKFTCPKADGKKRIEGTREGRVDQ